MQVNDVKYTAPAFADANGIRICYDSFGDPANAPLVLIMGLAAQMILWEEDFCKQLAAHGFWVVRFDNRDIGLSTKFGSSRTPSKPEMLLTALSPKLSRPPYKLLDMAKDTVGLMNALSIGSAHVVGVSMGGAIAQELAIHFPKRVRTLTSIMSSTGNPKLPRPNPEALAVLTKRAPAHREAYLEQYAATWATLAGEYYPFNKVRTLQQGAASFERGINPPGVARQLLAIIASGNRSKALGSVRLPALVIHGSLDPLVPVEGGRDTARVIPGAKLLVIDGMGHTLPREVWPQIIGAIEQHARSRP